MSSTEPRTGTYSERATATRSRRQAKGMYTRPTRDQRAAWLKYTSGCGVQAMTADECVLLAGHPFLARSQQTEWMGRALAKGWQ